MQHPYERWGICKAEDTADIIHPDYPPGPPYPNLPDDPHYTDLYGSKSQPLNSHHSKSNSFNQNQNKSNLHYAMLNSSDRHYNKPNPDYGISSQRHHNHNHNNNNNNNYHNNNNNNKSDRHYNKSNYTHSNNDEPNEFLNYGRSNREIENTNLTPLYEDVGYDNMRKDDELFVRNYTTDIMSNTKSDDLTAVDDGYDFSKEYMDYDFKGEHIGYDVPQKPNVSANDSKWAYIPKNILQIRHKGTSKKSGNSIRQYMPNWNYILFDRSSQKEFIRKYFPSNLSQYKAYKNQECKDLYFVYMYLYIHGGIYIDSTYELTKSLESLFDSFPSSDLYFFHDMDRYISHKFIACQAFCDFWLQLLSSSKMRTLSTQQPTNEAVLSIDYQIGRDLLTYQVSVYTEPYTIIPRDLIDPYTYCDTQFTKNSYLRPIPTSNTMYKYVKCRTGSSDEMLYTSILCIFIVILLIVTIITY